VLHWSVILAHSSSPIAGDREIARHAPEPE
jgi:hypothetical protein